MFDYVIVGAGFTGAVTAERIASVLDKRVLIIEQRNHIGGNAYDRYEDKGVLIHHYGPHIFHTKIKAVWEYLSQFTEWHHYHHRVLGSIDGRQVPIPFNLNSLYALLADSQARSLERKLIEQFGYNVKVPILKLRETDDEELRWLADYVYEKVFLHYTTKQWGMKPEELDPYVTGRVPVYVSRDDRYFQDPYQGLPREGYTRMFERMLHHPRIKLLMNTDFREVLEFDRERGDFRLFGAPFSGKVIYTGKIDELFDYEYGELPYRSLRFDFETLEQDAYQPVGTVNYPNEYDFTRITEFKHLTGQKHSHTAIVREYPQPYERNTEGRNIPYYPIPKPENQKRYEAYLGRSKAVPNLILAGRLAEYKYYDMDACVAKALRVFEEKIRGSAGYGARE